MCPSLDLMVSLQTEHLQPTALKQNTCFSELHTYSWDITLESCMGVRAGKLVIYKINGTKQRRSIPSFLPNDSSWGHEKLQSTGV